MRLPGEFESGLCCGHLPDVTRPFGRACGIVRFDMNATSTLSFSEVRFERGYDAAVADVKVAKMGLDAFVTCNCLRDGKLSDLLSLSRWTMSTGTRKGSSLLGCSIAP